MKIQDLEHMLAATLEDQRLSRGERRAIRQVLGEHDLADGDRRRLRNRAFALVADELDSYQARRVLDWLHDLVKAIDSDNRPRESEALFSPEDPCQHRILRFLGSADKRLDICVFTITDNAIAEAIEAAFRRGVEVRVITDDDKSLDRGSDVDHFVALGIPLRIDRTDGHMHHKFAITDGRLLLNGSYNWTRSAALSNHENIAITDDRALVVRYAEQFERLWKLFSN